MKTLLILVAMWCFCCTTGVSKTSAVIEEWKTYYVVPAPDHLVLKEYVRIKIMDENGYHFAIFRDYYNSFKKIKSLHYTVFDASNKKVKRFNRGDALDVMLNPSYEISDARMLLLDPQFRQFPFTVEIEVESTFSGFLGFPVWTPRYTHDLEVKHAELVLESYKDFYFKSRELNGIAAPAITETDKVKVIRWSVKDLPAIEKYASYRSFAADQAKVHISPIQFTLGDAAGDFSDWVHFGQWYYVLNKDRNTVSDATKEYLDSLRKQYSDDDQAICKAVYQFMQGRTRYISIQLGIGGYQTIPSDEVERTGYGDCKALTNYMGAMLSYLKIPSNNVLVKAGRDVPDILHDFPSNQFNHVFLAVPQEQDTLWFECTSQTAPPSYIGTFTDDRFALWIDEEESRIIRTPAFEANESVIASNCFVKMEPRGDAQLKLEVTQRGMFYDEAMYFENLQQDKIERFNYSKFTYKDFSLQSFNFAFPEKDSAILNLSYDLKVNGLGKPLGSRFIMPSNVLLPIEKFLTVDLIKKMTEIRRPFTIEDSVQISAPENYRFSGVPENVIESYDFGTFEMRFEKYENDDVLRIFRRAIIKKGKYEADTFGRFYEMLQAIRAIEQKQIVLQSKT